MNKSAIPLGRILGIPIGVDYSWFLIFGFLTWSLATSYYPAEFKNWPVAQYWIVGAVTAILMFVSVLLHELGHSVIALHYKIPVRSITLFIFGGVAQIGAEPPSAVAEFWIAIAGPVTSFALALVLRLAATPGRRIGTGVSPGKISGLYQRHLALFNLIPGFPLDGGRVFRAIIWGATHSFHRATTIAATVGRIIAYLFIGFGVWQIFSGNLFNGLWIAFIGWFLESAANAQLSQLRFHDLLVGHTIAQAMTRNYAILPGDISLQKLADEHILRGRKTLLCNRRCR